MSYANILYESKNGIVKITLNRPQILNALDGLTLVELKAAVDKAAKDDDVNVIVLTGAGRAFSAGVDLRVGHKSSGDKFFGDGHVGSRMDNLARDLIKTIQTAPKVVIAMVNGYCLTGALELVLTCDLIIASEEAKFGDTHVRWGARPSWGMSQRLPRMIGLVKAKELSFTAEMISAHEAERLNLINRVVPAEQLEKTVQELTKKIMANSLESIAAYKQLYYLGMAGTLEQGLEIEAETPFEIKDSEKRVQKFRKRT